MEKFTEVFSSKHILISPTNVRQFIKNSTVQFASIGSYLNERKPKVLPLEPKRIIVEKINTEITLIDAIDWINSKKGIMPNVEGLSVAIPFLQECAHLEKPIFGFDEPENLWYSFVPFCVFDSQKNKFGLSMFNQDRRPKTTGAFMFYFID